MKKHLAILFLLSTALLCGLWLGQTARPENFQLRGGLTFDPAQVPSGTYEVGDLIVRWQAEDGGQLTVEAKDRPGFALWQTIPGEAFVMAAQGNETVTENRGMFKIADRYLNICQNQQITSIGAGNTPSFLEIRGELNCQSRKAISYSLLIYLQESTLQLNLATDSNRVFIAFQSTPNEHFFGFGEQFTYFDMKGKLVPIWVSEQGVGRGLQPLTFFANLTNGGAGGDAFTTYAPIPFYITNQMRAIYLVNDGYTSFDLRKPDRVVIKAFGGGLVANISDGANPAEIIKVYTDLTGKMKTLPDWVHGGAIVGMQGGTEKVRDVYAQLEQRNTPITAFWLQDWVGQRTTSFGKQLWWNWEVSQQRYPNWKTLVNDLENDGVRMMVYVNPYLVDVTLNPDSQRNLFNEALQKDYLINNSQGQPYLVLNTDFRYGMVDLTNPDARLWLSDVIQKQVLDMGASGYMADFGESLPYDAVLHDPNDSSSPFIHNRWPVMWSGFNRSIVDQNDNDVVFFSRAAFTGSPQVATLFWEGDQLVDWSAEDGIKSAVTGLNTSGLSGMAFNHSDIGGYTTITSPIKNYHRSRELLYRWMEMNAFTLIFRTHEGNQPENNVQFYTDDETLDTFAYWAKVYTALFDYRKQLVAEAVSTGLPVVRHPFIHYPDDPETWKITYQEFMLGEDFLIAPVTDPGADEVEAYLPRGHWVHLWSGAVYGSEQRGEYVTVSAPIGQPGVFYKEGSQAGEDFVHKLENQGLLP